ALARPFLEDEQRLVWAAVLEFDAVPTQALPPWFFEQHNFTRRRLGVDLFSLDGQQALLCRAGNCTNKEVKRFLRTASCLFEAPCCTLWTDGCNVSADSQRWLKDYGGQRKILTKKRLRQLCCDAAAALVLTSGQALAEESSDPPLRPCQEACLEACAKRARVIEMACGTGKTRVIRELAERQKGKVLVTVPSRLLLEQFASEMAGFCKVGMHYNEHIEKESSGFVAVTKSVHLLQKLEFEAVFIDEAHHPLPPGLPSGKEVFKFSATQKEEADFRYGLGEAIGQGVLCDYDLTVPVVTEGHPYICLADLLLSQAGRFRRVLAYCNSVAEAKRFRQVLETVGLAAWHINGKTSRKKRERVMEEFSDELQKPVHVLVTVQVLGEGVNIPNADTCMFVEPRSSYVSIIQAIGRVLRPHPTKPLAHIVLPAVALPATTNRAAMAPPGLSHPAGGAQSIARTTGSVEHVQSPESDGLQQNPGSVDAPRVRAAVGAIARNGSKNFHGRQLTYQASETSGFAGSGGVPPAALEASSGSFRLRTNADDHHETERVRCQSSLPQQDRLDSLGASAALRPASTTALEATALAACEQVGVGGAGKQMKPTQASWDEAAEGRFGGARRPSAPAQNDRSESGAGPPSAGFRAKGRGAPKKLQAAFSTAGRQSHTTNGAEFRRPSSQSPAPTDGQQGVEVQDGWSKDEEAGLQTHPARPASATPPATASQQEALLVQMRSPSRQLPVASATALAAAPGNEPADVVPRQHGTGPEPSMESEENSRSVTHRRASKLKVKHGDSAGLFGSGHADQLGRFLEAIAQADSRFANKDIRMLQSRLGVTDCRLQQPAMQMLLARDLQHQLTLILQQRDAFDLRLQAVEKFDQDHGRLPRQRGNQLEEKSLADWLRNLGYAQKHNMLSAERMQRLLNSSCSMLRARAAKWLVPDVFFEEVLQELRQFVHVHHRMPSAGKQHPRAERRLIESVRGLASPAMRSFKRRLQLLEKVDPIVADWVKSRRTRQIRVCEVLWNSQYDRLLGFVEVNERLPRQRLERPLHSWLYRQRIQMNYLPANLQAKLIHIHPVVTAFLRS
ncbi:irc3, partial [Symbiodinium sp. KB8]